MLQGEWSGYCRAGRTETSVNVASRDVPAICNKANFVFDGTPRQCTHVTVQISASVSWGTESSLST